MRVASLLSTILTIAGSIQQHSRSKSLLDRFAAQLAAAGFAVDALSVRDLPADDLFHARLASPPVAGAIERIGRARAVIVGTPVYKAAYSGAIKSLLDVLPQDALADAIVLPVATGGSLAHLLAVDYALKPVLSALSARWILPSVFAVDSQFAWVDGQGHQPDAAACARIDRAVDRLVGALAALAARCPA